MVSQKLINQWMKNLNAVKIGEKTWKINLTDKVFIELDWQHANHDFGIDFLDVAPLGKGRILADYTGNLPAQFLESIIDLAKDYAVEQDIYNHAHPSVTFREYITKKTGLKFTLYSY